MREGWFELWGIKRMTDAQIATGVMKLRLQGGHANMLEMLRNEQRLRKSGKTNYERWEMERAFGRVIS